MTKKTEEDFNNKLRELLYSGKSIDEMIEESMKMTRSLAEVKKTSVLLPNCQAVKKRGFESASTWFGDLYPKAECR